MQNVDQKYYHCFSNITAKMRIDSPQYASSLFRVVQKMGRPNGGRLLPFAQAYRINQRAQVLQIRDCRSNLGFRRFVGPLACECRPER